MTVKNSECPLPYISVLDIKIFDSFRATIFYSNIIYVQTNFTMTVLKICNMLFGIKQLCHFAYYGRRHRTLFTNRGTHVVLPIRNALRAMIVSTCAILLRGIALELRTRKQINTCGIAFSSKKLII